MKRISLTLVIALILMISVLSASPENDGSDIDGYWEGSLNIHRFNVGFSTEFAAAEDSIIGLMDIPKQNAYGLMLENIHFDGDSIYFEYNAPIGLATYSGFYDDADDVIRGDFNQNNVEGTFVLRRPKEIDAPFEEIDVKLELKDVILSGTLTLPDLEGKYPAVLLITGSGAQNRDEQIGTYRPFAEIAAKFALDGIATLRFDDPGIGDSHIKGDTMEYSKSVTTEDFERHAWKEFKYMRKHPNVDKNRCGVLGHSEGGIIAAMLADRSKKIDFVILLATPAVPGSLLIIDQIENMMNDAGASEKDIKNTIAIQRKVSRAVTEDKVDSTIYELLREDIVRNMDFLPLEMMDMIEDSSEYIEQQLKIKKNQLQMEWTSFFMSYDPKKALKGIRCPAYAIFGDDDQQVSVDLNLAPMDSILNLAPTDNYEIITLENTNHFFQTIIKREDQEPRIREEMPSGFNDMMIKWIRNNTEKE